MKEIVFAFVVGGTVALVLPLIRSLLTRGQQFPFDSLEFSEGSISASISYNPHSDYPPKLRWLLGVSFKEIHPPGSEFADSPFISYTLDLGFSDWRLLPGQYSLTSVGGSDMRIDGVNFGPVDVTTITLKEIDKAVFEITMDLVFNFHTVPFKQEHRTIVFEGKFRELSFCVPMWTKPSEIEFPESWGIPSAKPHWTDDRTRGFVSQYADLSTYSKVSIIQQENYTLLEAVP